MTNFIRNSFLNIVLRVKFKNVYGAVMITNVKIIN